jgi:hypothetical protein
LQYQDRLTAKPIDLQTATANYKLIKKIKDERFDEELLHQYDLLIQTSPKDFQIAVIDSKDNRILILEDYAMGNVQSHAELLQALKDLFDAHALLKAGFWKGVKIGIKNNKFCQVPASLFVESSASNYLKFNATVDESKEKIIFCKNITGNTVTVFAVQDDLHSWLSSIYQNTSHLFFHQSTALIEGVLKQSNRKENPLYIYVDRFKLHVLSAQNGKLIYYNQFSIKQFPDYVKYIMLVLNGLNMDQHKSEIILWGYIGKNSTHYQEFVKYIRNVKFGERPTHLKFSYLFDEVQEHHFFDLYSLQLLNA